KGNWGVPRDRRSWHCSAGAARSEGGGKRNAADHVRELVAARGKRLADGLSAAVVRVENLIGGVSHDLARQTGRKLSACLDLLGEVDDAGGLCAEPVVH